MVVWLKGLQDQQGGGPGGIRGNRSEGGLEINCV